MSLSCSAQSYVTYNHDDAKMKQIMVMETGAGSLTPEFYYTLLHNSYKKSAAEKNKLGFRTLAAIGSYQQVEYADSIESFLTKRAEVEALNMVDRQIDLAWKTEGSKINAKLSAFQNNINRIVPAGGSPQDYDRWSTYYKVYQSAIKSTQDVYMPNAQRKKEYLKIYEDLCKQNDILVRQLVMMNNAAKTEQMLATTQNYTTSTKKSAISAAFGKWKEAGLSTRSRNTETYDDGGDGEETVNR